MILDTLAEGARRRARVLEEADGEGIREAAIARALDEDVHDFPFERNLWAEGVNIICEVKKASPSKGIIADHFPYLEIARDYERAGAAAISVLTEPDYFLGSGLYLKKISRAVQIPILRKDFIVSEVQIYESKLLGASAILLIVSILTDEELTRFIRTAKGLGLSALVETRTEEEIRRAVLAGARIIGVNNRDLRDFSIDNTRAARLHSLVPEDTLFIAESGIQKREDIEEFLAAGIRNFLIGEAMMKAEDKAEKLAEFIGEEPRVQCKICGISRERDIDFLNDALPDYVGFIFARSPRKVTPDKAAGLISLLDPRIKAVGVFVNETAETIADIAKKTHLFVIQLHGDEDFETIREVKERTGLPVWKAIRAGSEEDILPWNDSPADALLLDAKVMGKRGGTGKRIDPNLARAVRKPFLLAGGMNCENIVRAARIARPFAVDVNSGVETDGMKDKEKIQAVIRLLARSGLRKG